MKDRLTGHLCASDLVSLLNVRCAGCNDSIGSHTTEEIQECQEFVALIATLDDLSVASHQLISGRRVSGVGRITRQWPQLRARSNPNVH